MPINLRRAAAALAVLAFTMPLTAAEKPSNAPESCAPSQVGTMILLTTREPGEWWFTYLLPGVLPAQFETCLLVAGACQRFPVAPAVQSQDLTIGACYRYEVAGNPLTVVAQELLHFNACVCGD